jgi:hypothetical protein
MYWVEDGIGEDQREKQRERRRGGKRVRVGE